MLLFNKHYSTFQIDIVIVLNKTGFKFFRSILLVSRNVWAYHPFILDTITKKSKLK